jgi:hypothetical protein
MNASQPVKDVAFQVGVGILYTASSILEVYAAPAIALVGLYGNVLSFFILSLPKYRDQSTCIYMKGMAISDSMYLALYVLQRTAISLMHEKMRDSGNFKWFCNQFFFWLYYSSLASSIILQTMSLDRLLALLFPLRSKAWCNPEKARIIIITIFLVLCIIMLPINLLRERQSTLPGWLCPFHFNGKLRIIFDQFIAIAGAYMPVIIIFICNVGIIAILQIGKKKRKNLAVDSNSSKDGQIIRMLMVVSITFLVMKIPARVRNAYWAHYTGGSTPLDVALQRFTVTLSVVVEYCNYALNTYLYILPVEKFRNDARTVMCISARPAK